MKVYTLRTPPLDLPDMLVEIQQLLLARLQTRHQEHVNRLTALLLFLEYLWPGTLQWGPVEEEGGQYGVWQPYYWRYPVRLNSLPLPAPTPEVLQTWFSIIQAKAEEITKEQYPQWFADKYTPLKTAVLENKITPGEARLAAKVYDYMPIMPIFEACLLVDPLSKAHLEALEEVDPATAFLRGYLSYTVEFKGATVDLQKPVSFLKHSFLETWIKVLKHNTMENS